MCNSYKLLQSFKLPGCQPRAAETSTAGFVASPTSTTALAASVKHVINCLPVLSAGNAAAQLPLHAISHLTHLTRLRLHCSCSPQQLHTLCSTLEGLQHLELGTAAAASQSGTAGSALFGCCSAQYSGGSSSCWHQQSRVAGSNSGAAAGPDGLSALGWLSSSLQHLTLKDGCITAATAAGTSPCVASGVGVLPALAGAGVLCCSLPLLPQLSRLTSLCLLPGDGCGAMLSK
jgi:hypothetical protein